MDALIDVDEWIRIIAAEHFVGNWDSFGYSDGSNMYFYRPLEGKWHLCIFPRRYCDSYRNGVIPS